MNFDANTFKFTDGGKTGRVALVVGIVFMAISVAGYFVDSTHFFLTYLVSFFFWLSISLGGLFFTMVHHLTGAKWSTVLRRLSESVSGTIPLMVVLFIPVVFGIHELFEWSHAEVVANDAILQKKAPYLNQTFFIIRALMYFVIWYLLYRLLWKNSERQDARHEDGLTKKARVMSAPGVILFAVTITFASFDWLMSLDAHWFSTIFGVYVFSGAFLAILSFMVLAAAFMRRNSILADTITVEHYHDMGKFIFAFIIFWTYMAFSQYMLIWYGNIPEETYWFLYRWENSWQYFSLVLIFGHFVFPFVALLTRASKRSVGFLSLMAVWILLMRWVDLYWLVMPAHLDFRQGISFSWMDVTTMIGMGGLFVWIFWRRLTSQAVVPVNDPGLAASIQFTNN